MRKTLKARVTLPRLLLGLSVVPVLLLSAGCGLFSPSKKIQVPQLLGPAVVSNRESLIQEINRLAEVKSIQSKIDIQFEDTSFASVGIADQFKQVEGRVIVQNPGKIYLVITFTFVDIAQMASDGEHFSVAVLRGDDKYKRFVKGTNNAVYEKLEVDDPASAAKAKTPQPRDEKQTVSALSNLRPQHLTDAFMIRPVASTNQLYSLSEFFLEEADTRPQAKKGARVMRPYYLLEELSEPKDGQTQVLRRFWFDRVDKVKLARVQSYDGKGALINDVSYFNERPVGEAAVTLPTRIQITRPKEQYKLSISYQEPGSVELNKAWQPEVFILQNKWGLTEVDLDQTQKKVTANQ